MPNLTQEALTQQIYENKCAHPSLEDILNCFYELPCMAAHKSNSECLPGLDGHTYFRKSVASALLGSGLAWHSSCDLFRAQQTDVLIGRIVARSEEKRMKNNHTNSA